MRRATSQQERDDLIYHFSCFRAAFLMVTVGVVGIVDVVAAVAVVAVVVVVLLPRQLAHDAVSSLRQATPTRIATTASNKLRELQQRRCYQIHLAFT